MGAFPWSSYKKECSAEFVGTYLLVLFGAGSVIVSASINGTIALVFVACVFGGPRPLQPATVVYCYVPVATAIFWGRKNSAGASLSGRGERQSCVQRFS